ncbi:type IV secretion system protein [Xenorhabdus bovienii]|uniref:type IV secretion system protein n=1 Tax=Xenorhabdus bovienii TaxID=40576 RepID=UPI0023B326E2|nr:type IV secretion system protein [Xenorhabdus bovienii]MDE9544135.1 type IV secretion system protein [Xenorhabdus bovienii]
MEMGLAEGIFKSIEVILTNQVAGNFQKIYSIIFPVWTAGVILYYVVQAWEIIYSDKQIIVNEFIKHFMVLAIVTTFLGANSIYIDNVVPAVMNSGQEIASKLFSDDSSSMGSMIDQMIDQIMLIGQKSYEEFQNASGVTDTIVAGLLMIAKITALAIFGGAFVLYATSYLLVAMVMIGVLLSLGGIFIAFAAFPATRQMFTAWVGSCFNYIFLNIGYAILFGIIIEYINQYIALNIFSTGSETGDNAIQGVWSVFVICIVFSIGSFLIQQVATLMSILTGGVGINGLTGATNAFVGKAAGALGLKSAGRALGQGAGALASGAGRGAANITKEGWTALNGGGRIKP